MWKEKYKIGVPLIDQQHEELFKRVFAFIQTFREQGNWEIKQKRVIETLDFMQDYVVVHFHDEEKYQEEINYPDIVAHKEEHYNFKKKVNEYVTKLNADNFSESLVQEFGGKLMTWLIMHVAGSDQKIGSYVEGLIKVDYIDPLYYATKEIFQLMLDIETTKSNLTVVNHVTSHEENKIVVELGVIGDLQGKIVFSFPADLTLSMLKTMCGMDVVEVDTFVSSALGEIVNIISGNALTKLTEKGLVCDILPPKIIVENYHDTILKSESYLYMPIASQMGNFDIHVLLKKANLV